VKGARYDNRAAGTWDVGWSGLEGFPERIQGIYVLDFCKDGADGNADNQHPVRILTGRKKLALSDFGLTVKGIPVPFLGVSVDVAIADEACGDYVHKVFADDGTIVRGGWRRGGRSRIESTRWRPWRIELDSRELDSNSDGFWAPGILREINSHGVPAGLGYTAIIPATWFAVPPPRGGERYKTLRFTYLGSADRREADISLREDYISPDGSLTIGFIYHGDRSRYHLGGASPEKVFVVQSCNKGGVIVARINGLADARCLQIVKGTLTVSQAGEIHPSEIRQTNQLFPDGIRRPVGVPPLRPQPDLQHPHPPHVPKLGLSAETGVG